MEAPPLEVFKRCGDIAFSMWFSGGVGSVRDDQTS